MTPPPYRSCRGIELLNEYGDDLAEVRSEYSTLGSRLVTEKDSQINGNGGIYLSRLQSEAGWKLIHTAFPEAPFEKARPTGFTQSPAISLTVPLRAMKPAPSPVPGLRQRPPASLATSPLAWPRRTAPSFAPLTAKTG